MDFPKLDFGSIFSICLREDSPNERNPAKQLYIRDDNAGYWNRDPNYGGLEAELAIRLQSPGSALYIVLCSQYRVGGNSFWSRECYRFRSPPPIDQFGLLGAPQISLTP